MLVSWTTWLLLTPPLLLAGVVLAQRAFTVVFLLGAHLHFWRYMRFKGRSVPHGGLRLLRYWWLESQAMTWLTWWRLRQILRLDVLDTDHTHDHAPVLGIHGYTQNASNFWGLRRMLHDDGRASHAVDLGLPFMGIESYTTAVRGGIDHLLEQHPHERIDIVCHSMGGLVLRHLLAEDPDLAKRIRRVVTLGSPHHGTAASRGMFAMGKDAKQMKRNHTFTNTLPHLHESAPHVEHVAICAQQDYIVYPRETSLPEGANHVVLPNPGHAGLLVSKCSLQAIMRALS
mgnify:CR=1 FL=1